MTPRGGKLDLQRGATVPDQQVVAADCLRPVSPRRRWLGNRGRRHRRSQRPWGSPAFLPVGGRPVRREQTARAHARSDRREPRSAAVGRAMPPAAGQRGGVADSRLHGGQWWPE
eukprot:9552660-Alexandrium_andersonii.AAC.1